MVYISEWEAFFTAAQEMFKNNFQKSRLSIKYRNCDPALHVKVTDDNKTITFKTNKRDDIRYVERLQQWVALNCSNPENFKNIDLSDSKKTKSSSQTQKNDTKLSGAQKRAKAIAAAGTKRVKSLTASQLRKRARREAKRVLVDLKLDA